MPITKPTALTENEHLKREFASQKLDLEPVWQPSPDDLERENRQLRQLLDWVRTYRDCPDRRELIKRGYHFPPLDPEIDPKTDWLRFERWLHGQPLRWNFVAEFGALPDPDELTDEQLELALERVIEVLAQRGICVDVYLGVPSRISYAWLRHHLATTDFELAAPGCWCHIGCAGHCPDCFQQPWCEVARELAALEGGRERVR